MEYARISQALEGGIESPLQFTIQVFVILKKREKFISTLPFFQVYLIITGKLPKPWLLTSTKVVEDLKGNEFILLNPTRISLIFSLISMMKAVYAINIVSGIHFKVCIQDF